MLIHHSLDLPTRHVIDGARRPSCVWGGEGWLTKFGM